MLIIPVQELDEIANDHFGSGDVQTQSSYDEAELQEQPQADDVDEVERDDPLTGENESRPLFLTHCRYADKSFIEMFLEYSATEYMYLIQNAAFVGCYGIQKDKLIKTWQLKG